MFDTFSDSEIADVLRGRGLVGLQEDRQEKSSLLLSIAFLVYIAGTVLDGFVGGLGLGLAAAIRRGVHHGIAAVELTLTASLILLVVARALKRGGRLSPTVFVPLTLASVVGLVLVVCAALSFWLCWVVGSDMALGEALTRTAVVTWLSAVVLYATYLFQQWQLQAFKAREPEADTNRPDVVMATVHLLGTWLMSVVCCTAVLLAAALVLL